MPESADIDRLVAELDDASYATRLGAARRLERLWQQPAYTLRVIGALKTRLADSGTGEAAYRELKRLCDRARGHWLLSDPATWKLPAVSPPQIAAWVDSLALSAQPGSGQSRVHENAERELLDLLARDEYVDSVRQALVARLADQRLDPAAAQRLQAIYDWTKPGLIAEYWEGPHHQGIQYLYVDVPSVPEGAERASHFDRIDDRTAHCASGNSLSPGDYPVGVFFPHPQKPDAQFQLVNLPTPRQRLAYEYQVRRDEAVRHKEIAARTLARLLTRGAPLTFAELMMLDDFDDEQVSHFAGDYFVKVDDSHYTDTTEAQMVGNLSRHQNLCHLLARHGTHAAIGGLVAAIRAGRFLDPPPETPYDWPWVAALSIAARDPWPEVDDWLASLIDKGNPLYVAGAKQAAPATSPTAATGSSPTQRAPQTDAANPTTGDAAPAAVAPGGIKVPELGASAAALLLARHGHSPLEFGLEPLLYPPLTGLSCPGYSFRLAEDRAKVLAWWTKAKLDESQAVVVPSAAAN